MNNSRPIWHFCICHFIFVLPLMRNDIPEATTRRDHEFICVQCIELSISYFKSSTIKSNLSEEFNEAKFTYLIASLTVSIQPAIRPPHPIPYTIYMQIGVWHGQPNGRCVAWRRVEKRYRIYLFQSHSVDLWEHWASSLSSSFSASIGTSQDCGYSILLLWER